jgi:hypothetical protein
VTKLGPGSLQSWAGDVITVLREAHRAVDEARARGDTALDQQLLDGIRHRYDKAAQCKAGRFQFTSTCNHQRPHRSLPHRQTRLPPTAPGPRPPPGNRDTHNRVRADKVWAVGTVNLRVRARPVRRHGHTLIPLTRRPGGLRAYKVLLPSEPEAELRTHEVHVLSDRVRLRLADLDLVMKAGEAAEFDTRTPHGFGRVGPAPAELLVLFGPRVNACTSAPVHDLHKHWAARFWSCRCSGRAVKTASREVLVNSSVSGHRCP